MRAIYQIVCWLSALVFVVYVGSVLETCIWQSGMMARKVFAGLPMDSLYQGFPVPSEFTGFLFKNEEIASYLVVFPWVLVIFLGAIKPKTFFRPTDFMLRFVAFLSMEFVLLLILIWSILSPFIDYILQLKTEEPTTLEKVVPIAFWLFCLYGLATAVFCFVKHRRSEQGAGH